jgi:hypothetical protein
LTSSSYERQTFQSIALDASRRIRGADGDDRYRLRGDRFGIKKGDLLA